MSQKYLSLLIIALLAAQSCKKDELNPVLSLNKAQAITNPASNGNYVLTFDSKDDVWENITWTAAEYNLNNVGKTYYNLEMDVAGNNFAAPINLGTTTELSIELTAGQLNNLLILKGLAPDEPISLELRVSASVEQKSDKVYSQVVVLTITPFSAPVILKQIYLLGSATTVGWDNANALPMTYNLDSNYYEIVTTLTAGSDKFVKAISKLGAWAPQWGTDASGTSVNGPLVYRPTEDVADPPAIPAPDFTSQFKITFDTINLAYEIFEYGDVWLLGDGTAAGWDNTKALPFTKVDDDGKYSIITNLEGGKNWKIIDERGKWAPQWGTDGAGTPNAGALVLRPTESEPDPSAISTPTESGLYLIEIDIVNLTYKVTLQ